MDRRSVDWQGPMTAIVTPFFADGRIDEASFRSVVELQLEAGVTGIVVGGCTGEFWALSNAERRWLHEACVKAVAGRVPVIAGTSAMGTPETIELTAHAQAVGCDGAMLMPPWFVRLSPEDLVAHYRAVSDAVKFPLMAYNIPSTNINALTPELVDRLADIDTVVAIKESSFDYQNFYRTITRVNDRLLVFAPTREFGCAALQLGAVGSVGVLHHIWGRNLTEWHNTVLRGDIEGGMRMQRMSEAIGAVLTGNGRSLYAGIKGGMQVLGFPGGVPRSPLRPLSAAQLQEIAAGLRALGLGVAATCT